MPTPEELKAPFVPETFYHMVCKSIDGILLFPRSKDYEVFIERFQKFMGDFISTWAYCLMNNHSHHILKIKPLELVMSFVSILPEKEKTKSMQAWTNDIKNQQLFDEMLERQMNRFLVSYANYFNNKYKRRGGVFQSPFKRIKITNEGHLQQAIIYVHANAQKHGVVKDYKEYHYSSYQDIIKHTENFIDTGEVLAFFGAKDKFVEIHDLQVAYFYSQEWPNSKLE